MIVIDVLKTKENLNRLMKENGLTKPMIAEELCVSVTIVYRWVSKTNGQLPKLENLFMLADLFKCSVEDIIVKERI